MLVRILWHPLFVCAPTKFCRCNAFFVEAFNRPRVAELVDFFWLVGNLRIAFGDMNDFGASELREHIELFGFKSGLQCCSTTSCFAVFQQSGSDVNKCTLHQVAHHAWVCTVFDNCRWSVVGTPALDHLAHFLVTHIQRAVLWTRGLHVLVRVPEFHRSVQVANSMVATPFNNGWAINVPRKVEQNVAIANACAEK